MPTVPTYSRPQVGQAALPGVRQSSNMSPALAGGIAAEQADQLGRGLGALGDVVARQELKERAQADQVRVNDAMNKAVGAKLKLTYDKEIGFNGLRGEAALNRPDGKPLDQEYGELFDKHVAEITASLGNDNQRREFRMQADQMAMQFRGGLQQHVAKEYGDYQLSVQDGTVKTAQDQMGLAWDDPVAVAQSKGAIEAAVFETGRLKGWSPQQVQAATTDQLSRGHVSVLAAAADAGKLDYAREYLKANKDSMTPEARLAATKVLDAGDFEARTQGAADSLYGGNKGDVAAALAAAREKYSGKEEDAIVNRIKGLDGERVALRERAQKDASDAGWDMVAKGRMPSPSLLAAMDGKDAIAMRRHLADGPARKTSVPKWLEFTNMSPEQMAAMSPNDLLREYGNHFTDSDIRQANEMMRAAKGLKGQGSGSKDGLQLMTANDLVKRGARELGIIPTKGEMTPEQETAFDGFRYTLQTKINNWEAQAGKKASPEVLQEIMQTEKLNKVKLDVWGSDPERAVITLSQDDAANAYVTVNGNDVKLSSIPPSYRQDAMRRMKARGLPVSEALVAQMWVADKDANKKSPQTFSGKITPYKAK